MSDISISREELRKNGFPNPTPLSEKLFDSLVKEQQESLLALLDLADKEKKLCDKINSKRPTESGIVREGSAITLCQDDDDWLVITMKERSEREEVREEIKDNLNKSLDLGLGFLGLTQRQCKEYKVKI